ncbi:MAG TPA: hypothetical protein PLP23_21840 [Panacibacter sp.]|nr:hypothetical protein [Panacibacter sp.]
MKKSITIVVLFFCMNYYLHAQNSDAVLIDSLVENIAQMQVKDSSEFYSGMFYSYRECGGGPHNYQPDNNVFFTAITAFGLRNMLPHFDTVNKNKVERIIDKATATYPYFKNKYGEPFYNFWPTNAQIMPHSFVFKYLKSVFGQGEDADDAAMVLMSSNADDSTCNLLRQRMLQTSNLATPKRKIVSTYKRYKEIPAYSTYLGLRMPVDFDFGVQCNLLYFIYDRHLPFTKQDTATVYLLAEMVKNREYMKAPTYLSPYYVKSSVLLYHLTRLINAFHIPELEIYKPQLIDDIKSELQKSNNIMDKIILSTSLLRLGADAPNIDIAGISAFEKSNQKQYIFFQARAAFPYPSPFKQIFLHWSYINYYFYCPAYNKMLWLEYLVERN